jgi:hypothetical protein
VQIVAADIFLDISNKISGRIASFFMYSQKKKSSGIMSKE